MCAPFYRYRAVRVFPQTKASDTSIHTNAATVRILWTCTAIQLQYTYFSYQLYRQRNSNTSPSRHVVSIYTAIGNQLNDNLCPKPPPQTLPKLEGVSNEPQARSLSSSSIWCVCAYFTSRLLPQTNLARGSGGAGGYPYRLHGDPELH